MAYLIGNAPTDPTATLAVGIDAAAVQITLTGAYAEIPDANGSGDVAPLMLYDEATGLYEWVHVTNRTAAVCDILRGQEDTTAIVHAAGVKAAHGVPPGCFDVQPADFPSIRKLGTGATDAAAGNDSRMSDARVPTSHAASHAAAGSDPVMPAAIGLGNVNNTPDVSKPVSTAQAAADALALPKAGGTMTGALATISGTAAAPAVALGGSNVGFRRASATGYLCAGVVDTMLWSQALISALVKLQVNAGLAFQNSLNTGAIINLITATSRHNQIFMCAAGNQQINLPPAGGALVEYRFLDPTGLVGAANTCTVTAEDIYGVGGGGIYDTLNGVRGGSVVIANPSEVWECMKYGTAVNDASGDTPGAAYYMFQVK